MAAIDIPCVTFATHSIPDITRNDSLLAICTVPQGYCQPDTLAFHAADFAAFKHLFSDRCPAEQQAWLSACDPRHLPLLQHGSKDVKRAFDASVRLEEDPAKLMEAFAVHVKKLANDMRFKGGDVKRKLAIIVCGPTSPQQDILKGLRHPLSVEDTAQFLHVEDLRDIIGNGVDAVLITPNMHVGGWVVNMALTRSAFPRRTAQESEFTIRRTLRNTAPLFVNSSFNTLVREDSCMRDEPDRNNQACMIPEPHSAGQSASSNKFFGTIHEAAFSSLVVAPRMDTFNFMVDLDNWSELCGPRDGPLLADHAKQWQTLPDHGVAAASRSPFPYYCFGNSEASQLMHLKTLAFILRPEWTRDEADRGNHELQAVLDTAFGLSSTAEGMEEPEIEQAYIHFVHISVYRQALMSLADALVHLCGLQAPPSRCLHWQTTEAEDRFGFELDSPEVGQSILTTMRHLMPRMPRSTPRLANPITYGTVNDDFLRPALYLWRIVAAQLLSQPKSTAELGLDSTMLATYNDFVGIINQLRERTPEAIIKASPWAAGAGYALLKLLGKVPNSDKLRAGTHTKPATGVSAMPSEMMQRRVDLTGKSQANWRGGSRRAGGISSSKPDPWYSSQKSHPPKVAGRQKQHPLHRGHDPLDKYRSRYLRRPKETAGVHGGVNRFKPQTAPITPTCYYDPESSDAWIRRHEQPHRLQETVTRDYNYGSGSSMDEESGDLIDFSTYEEDPQDGQRY